MFRSWWQKIKQHPMISTFVSIACVLGIVLLIGGYFLNWDWTGFGPYTPPNSNFQRGKTLWDWLQLFFIPAAIAFGVWWLTRLQQQRDQLLADRRAKADHDAAEQRAKTERDIAADNQREAALQEYIGRISELLLEKKLRGSAEGDEVRNIARVRTLTLLTRIGSDWRTRNVLLFLYESHLIDKDEPIIPLEGAGISNPPLIGLKLRGANLSGVFFNNTGFTGADLSGANLSRAVFLKCSLMLANLQGATLSGAFFVEETSLIRADLSGANLSGSLFQDVDLEEANLSNANLVGATITKANLNGTDLSNANLKDATGITIEELEKQAISLQGATMPDGTKHP
jgi:uncharacterized protein YjbI with pentapeptide repeats